MLKFFIAFVIIGVVFLGSLRKQNYHTSNLFREIKENEWQNSNVKKREPRLTSDIKNQRANQKERVSHSEWQKMQMTKGASDKKGVNEKERVTKKEWMK